MYIFKIYAHKQLKHSFSSRVNSCGQLQVSRHLSGKNIQFHLNKWGGGCSNRYTFHIFKMRYREILQTIRATAWKNRDLEDDRRKQEIEIEELRTTYEEEKAQNMERSAIEIGRPLQVGNVSK